MSCLGEGGSAALLPFVAEKVQFFVLGNRFFQQAVQVGGEDEEIKILFIFKILVKAAGRYFHALDKMVDADVLVGCFGKFVGCCRDDLVFFGLR